MNDEEIYNCKRQLSIGHERPQKTPRTVEFKHCHCNEIVRCLSAARDSFGFDPKRRVDDHQEGTRNGLCESSLPSMRPVRMFLDDLCLSEQYVLSAHDCKDCSQAEEPLLHLEDLALVIQIYENLFTREEVAVHKLQKLPAATLSLFRLYVVAHYVSVGEFDGQLFWFKFDEKANNPQPTSNLRLIKN